MNIENKVFGFLAERLNVDKSLINLDTDIREDLNADSLDLFEVICDVETEYGMNIENPDEIITVRDVIELIESSTKKNAALDCVV